MTFAAAAAVGEVTTHGVVVMAYGTPEHPEELETYYTDIRRGRPPTDEQLADLRRRYEAIGGLSPLAERTRAQAAGVQRVLDRRHPGKYRVELGLKHASPRIEDAMGTLIDAGVRNFVYLVLAPHYSALSVGQYFGRADAVAEAALGGDLDRTRRTHWGDDPKLIDILAGRVRDALTRLTPGSRPEVLVTAHSLPERARQIDGLDGAAPGYEAQLRRTGELVAGAAGLASWRIAWQSAGRTPEPWIGPDILDVIRGLPGEGFDSVVVCPAGFTSDHLEVLYDIDIEARSVAEAVGLRLERTASLNDDPAFLELLADLVMADG